METEGPNKELITAAPFYNMPLLSSAPDMNLPLPEFSRPVTVRVRIAHCPEGTEKTQWDVANISLFTHQRNTFLACRDCRTLVNSQLLHLWITMLGLLRYCWRSFGGS